MAAKKKSRSGTNISDERRAELGHETLYLRPAAGTGAKLATLAALLGTSKADALAAAVDYALAGLASP
jgi:hypothetical protein